MTFSIVAASPESDEVGVAVHSKFLACAAIVSWARGGVGAVATQSFAEVAFGPRGLDLLEEGEASQAVLDRLLEGDQQREMRQVGIVSADGRAASFTGAECFEHAASVVGENHACQGNILASDRVVPAMSAAFRTTDAPFPERLVEALRAAQREGGDRRGQEAAGLYVAKPGGGYGGNHDRYIDLRVDHHPEPIEELARILDLHRLYFERPREEDLLDADAGLEREIDERLRALGKRSHDRDLWDDLFDYVGWENLEERWAGKGRVDPRVLTYLRDHSEGRTP
ncbi:MAG TPA: DUF1028 domain-containing protein [Actinomycetota bacterium]|nr:DUF1028 domain-containing protein [Actinomycetota bacterium]